MAAARLAPVETLPSMPEAESKLSMSALTEVMTAKPKVVPFKMPQFNPKIHLNFQPPKARHSFTELGLPKPHNAPDVCFTEPFQLFSEEGVRMIRRELFQKEFLDKYMRSWKRAPCYIGGHVNHDGVCISQSSRHGCIILIYLHRWPLLSSKRGITQQHRLQSTKPLAPL